MYLPSSPQTFLFSQPHLVHISSGFPLKKRQAKILWNTKIFSFSSFSHQWILHRQISCMSCYCSRKPIYFLLPSSVSDKDRVSKASKWPLYHKGLLFFPGKVDSLPYLKHLNATLKHFLPCTHQVILLLLTGKTDGFQPTISSIKMLTSCCSNPDLVHDQLPHFSPFNPVQHHGDGPKNQGIQFSTGTNASRFHLPYTQSSIAEVIPNLCQKASPTLT